MKKKAGWAFLLLLLAAALVYFNLPQKEIPAGAAAGEKLPDFSVPCLDGKDFRLADQEGKITVLNMRQGAARFCGVPAGAPPGRKRSCDPQRNGHGGRRARLAG